MKQKYQAPQVEIIQLENEGGVMSASLTDFGGNNSMFPGNTSRKSTNVSTSNSLQDLEDLVNDLFTVSK